MTSAEKIVYATNDVENSTLLKSSEFNESTVKKAPRCSLKAKIVTAGLTLVALTLGGLGYYYGTKDKQVSRPSYTYKRFVNQNKTIANSFKSRPLSLATTTTGQSCTADLNTSGTAPVPMPH